MLDRAMIEEIPHALAGPNPPQFLAQADVISKLLVELIPFRIAVWTIDWPLRCRMGLGLIHQIRYPCRDGLDYDLRALALQEFKHVEVSDALRDLCHEY